MLKRACLYMPDIWWEEFSGRLVVYMRDKLKHGAVAHGCSRCDSVGFHSPISSLDPKVKYVVVFIESGCIDWTSIHVLCPSLHQESQESSSACFRIKVYL